jgi:putative holliday junction resolvase
MKVLAVDPGEKRIGLAISDPTGTIARPLQVLKHQSREKDARAIVELALLEKAALIVVGQPLDSEGRVGFQARKYQRLAHVIQAQADIPVVLWDESGSTDAAIQSRLQMGVSRKKRKGHLDSVAACIILQDFLIENETRIKSEEWLRDSE